MSYQYSKYFKNITVALALVSALTIFGIPSGKMMAQEATTETETETVTEAEPTPTPVPTCGENTCGGEETPPASDNVTVIDTGDATSNLTTENNVNSSELTSPPPDPTPTPEATPTPEGPAEETVSTESSENNTGGEDLINTEVTNDSTAEVATDGESAADTGANSANDNSGTALISTGDANASADVINIVNTTITDSDGWLGILNFFASYLGDLDLRTYGFSEACQDNCTILEGDLTVSNNNTAYITNDIIVRSGTGDNSASGNLGDGIILTGDANAAANVFNVANTNIIGSNYLFLILNNFGSWAGDLILPSKYEFNCCTGEGDVIATNNNTAEIANGVSADAGTGDNEANGNGSGLVVTGDANSVTNVVTQANTNIFGSDSVFIAFRFFGDWDGEVFSAPDGFSWMETPGGLSIFGDSGASSTPSSSGDVNITNTNSANIQNNIRVLALTGQNKVNGNGGAGFISTGNANAAANVINVANTNVVGRNWILALVNVFGNWKGNIAFGRPNIWIGESLANVPNSINPGYALEYKLTAINNGDTDATDVRIKNDFNRSFLRTGELNGGTMLDDDTIVWNLGAMKPKEVKIISYTMLVSDSFPPGGYIVSNESSASLLEPDASTADNFERTSVLLYRPREANIMNYGLPDFKMTKTNNATTSVYAGGKVDYEIVLENNSSGRAYSANLEDKLYFEGDENPVDQKNWSLDTIYGDEEIKITYTLEIPKTAKPGTYTNKAKFSGKDEREVVRYFVFAESSIEVLAPLPEPTPTPTPTEALPESEPEVLGDTTTVPTINDLPKIIDDTKTRILNSIDEISPEEISDSDKIEIPPAPRAPRFFAVVDSIWNWFAAMATGALAAIYVRFFS
ncbi:hypothetical protein A3H65_02260 [Candidatus Giovannonibacteria bacterium RIFCSPLOWO2_02_FULL_45_14]|uniref:DUF11 domain-containing protein n=1 Tax=Candidatus Giovannonibacteria bacterium RIFCSPLOWO2_12_FULL_44_15 TaxID=1798364 RepID=A0A1F5Y1A1_9BACT|nr:MAG: hypothetical protein A3C75_03050 [Candidatus Giovannonibacteria bacterium RIFCSPHIGHO2_02_FULL_44_31]OGF76745.1 MAG: hypothetical protein A3E62_02985 [Candidatus Giovannonibacteria bacterium RIFCSPHIGHO2_12_FULL_44_29]OGF90729.1 MAG: hypothetical protein A3H65_02260 [Candidatus Giovannonibacteria bacterium RIFCSPLOWO2_02_FULL_45_14]OGF93826.1 MAG: hypothetical protein A3G54_02410 [Candidatus Giovannonibacteria bacterium RIFCSPLOWO2_12_FULL_44_15]